MTLTLPAPDAGVTALQRFALELLLQQPVPGPKQLLAMYLPMFTLFDQIQLALQRWPGPPANRRSSKPES